MYVSNVNQINSKSYRKTLFAPVAVTKENTNELNIQRISESLFFLKTNCRKRERTPDYSYNRLQVRMRVG